ncbi:hypothetical protein [Streptomyces sp. NPDC015350]|uniref:hypothetical protein n=1 Tax=Streptomyces sp. NPDC015350 TaxID=3364955 RepID=UPI0036F8A307
MGRWEGAREVLAATGADWDRRVFRLQVLARAGARLTFADTWAQAEPRSPNALALLAHVQALRSMAGGRGRGRSEAMEQAWELCDAAADALPADPSPYIVMLALLRFHSPDRDRADPRLEQLRAELARRREDLHTHVARLRAGLPDRLAIQAGHADFTRTNLLVQEDAITAILDVQGETCLPAWELGRAAFDPRTVTNNPSWMRCALRLIESYRAKNPGLPLTDVRASARIALLYMLFGFYGATTSEYGLPTAAAVDLQQHWAEHQVTIHRLLSGLDEVESALDTIRRSQ